VQAPFGFVTGCHAGDKFMVQATLASMRYYCPAVPICLVVDGAFDVSDLESEYDLLVLRVPELRSNKMRTLMSGNYKAKLAAMWEGPFEHYVWLDSDAIVWGDFIAKSVRMSIFRFFGVRFPFPQMPLKSHRGCRIFILSRRSCTDLIPSSNGGGTPTSAQEPSVAGETQYRSMSGIELSPGLASRRACLPGAKWEC